MRGAALAPGLLLLFAGVVAGPEEGFAAGEPVEGGVAVAGAGAADQALLGGAFQPARQGRAVWRVVLGGPALQDGLLAELLAGALQDNAPRARSGRDACRRGRCQAGSIIIKSRDTGISPPLRRGGAGGLVNVDKSLHTN